jgi:transposase
MVSKSRRSASDTGSGSSSSCRMTWSVRLMPPRYVKSYAKSQKNDAADAEAICEAVSRPTMRFVERRSINRV